ncbi:MAG: H-X9-DG-CTERM domain-containing protein [Planctomycetota bacterium]
MLQWMRAGDKHIQFASGASGYDVYYIYYATLAFWAAGGSYWDEWVNGNGAGFDGYIEPLIARMTNAGTSPDGPMGYYWPPSISCYYHWYGGKIYPTALATIAMEVSVGNYIPGSKYNTSVAGEHSYGYNRQIANDENGRRKPAGDTIIMMDYMLSGIDPADDPAKCIAPRHGGKANVLFGDGHVEALEYEDLIEKDLTDPAEPKNRIKSHMLSLQPGSDAVPKSDQ